jgi:1-acyl-sn-glycerol-3-phosphate acyltransferase
MFSTFCSLVLQILGWKITGDYPYHIKKCIIVVIPHTSNWDFPLGILIRASLKENITFFGKSSLFRFPFAGFFRSLGGIPVDRSKSTNFVDAVIKMYDDRENLVTVISPEGTRSKVESLKSGFYYIAKGVKIPIILCKFDYENREVHFAKPFYPTNDKEADFQFFRNHFKNVKGRNPELGWP